MAGWAKQRLKYLLDRLFLRSAIAETQTNTVNLRADCKQLKDSLLIAEKKLEYVSIKLEAYAEAQDQLNNAVLEEFRELRQLMNDLITKNAGDPRGKDEEN